MPANIEIKAVLKDVPSAHATAQRFSGSPPEVIQQCDFFFPSAAGRLKLRMLGAERGELIFYQRPDSESARRSDYLIARTEDAPALLEILTRTLGSSGVVRKTRSLYLVGQTRIHIDQVEDLGDFLEVEVVLAPGQSDTEARQLAAHWIEQFGIRDEDRVAVAYVDLLRGRSEAGEAHAGQ